KAHSAGVVHRDIKPDNIFLHQTPEGEIVKILDFGIAKLMDERVGTDFKLPTATSQLVGTPTYISPERFDGKPYDGRSDVYSLGIMIYEMLCGRIPFPGGDAGVWSIMMQHLSQPPTPLRELNVEIPETVEKIVMRTL